MKFENIQVISWDIYGDIHSSEKNLSHSILIPNNIMDTFLYNHLEPNNPILFIEIKDMNGFLYINTGDFVESCTAIVEHFNGDLELVTW